MANVNGVDIDLMPTEGMRVEAKRYREWKKDGEDGGTDDARTRATQILSGDQLSPDTVITMNAWFARHESDKSGKGFRKGEDGYPSNGRVSWAAWGGDAGQSWSRTKSNQIKKARERTMSEQTEERAAPDALKTGDFVSWSSSGGTARGKITRIVRDGSIDVPDSSFTITGTADDPAALITLYRNGEATDRKVGHKFSTLTKISPIRVISAEDKLQRKEVTDFDQKKARTFEFPFSSEIPVRRFFGDEVLSHERGSANLERLNGAAPFLFNHDPNRVLGVVESAYISDDDKRGYAKIRFSRSKFATEVLEDVKDGIFRGISFGYSLDEVEETDTGLRATKWTPHEVSLATIPADNSVGFGRSLVENISSESVTLEEEDIIINVNSSQKEDRSAVPTAQSNPSMEETTKEAAVEQKPSVEIDVQAEVQRALDENNARVAEITTTCREFSEYGAEDLTESLIKSNKSATEARSAILDLVKNKKATPIRSTDMIETKESKEFLEKKETKRYSFLRAINALANPSDRAAQEAASFEREVSDEAASRYGRPAKGLIVPNEVLKRDLNVGTAADGGNLVSTELLSGSFIEILRNKMAIMQAGVTMLTGLEGNISIPKQDGTTSAYWVGEGGAPTEGQQSFTQISMTPKTVGAFTDFTRKTLLQSSIDIEAFVRDDIAKKIALELDRTAIYGTGSSNQPLGLKDTSGIGSQSLTTFGTFAEYIGMETDVAVANAEGGSMKYLVNASARGALKSTEKATNTGMFVFDNNQINGYEAIVSNQLLNNDAIFGDFSQFIVGMWSGLDLTVDPYAGATAGTVRIIALQDIDYAIRQAGAFCFAT